MTLSASIILSAQVILYPASGRLPDGDAEITAANVSEYLPSSDSASYVSNTFSSWGFEVGPLVGNSFSVTAPSQLFSRVFSVTLTQADDESVTCLNADGSTTLELPLGNLPSETAIHIYAVTFTPPATLDVLQ